MEEDFQAWKDEMWHAICEHFNLAVSGSEVGRFDCVCMRGVPLKTHSSRQYALQAGEFPEAAVYTGEVYQLNAFKNQRGCVCAAVCPCHVLTNQQPVHGQESVSCAGLCQD
jgi:hypothetical protein